MGITQPEVMKLINSRIKSVRNDAGRASNIHMDNHNNNKANITDNTSGIFDTAASLDDLNEAVMELAELIGTTEGE